MDCLKAIVKGPAVGQAAKGILTAGAYKTVLYSYAKLVKMVKSYSVGLGTNALFLFLPIVSIRETRTSSGVASLDFKSGFFCAFSKKLKAHFAQKTQPIVT